MEEVKDSVVEAEGSTQETVVSGQESAVSTQKTKVIRKKPVTPAEQDQVIANFIEASKRKLLLVKETPEMLSLMTVRGFGLMKLAEGEALQQALEGSYAQRQAAIGKEKATQQAQEEARVEAQEELIDFRETTKAFFRTRADHSALGIVGVLPKDIDILMLSARTSYANAKKEPYKSIFAQYGYDEAGWAKAEATLTALESARIARAAAMAAGVTATATRNSDYDALVDWMHAFDKIAKVALRKRPDLLARL
jgi:hypothetical protein